MQRGDFETGIRLALQAILASPRFIFRFEEAPATGRPGQSYRLSDADLASRLSFFLWGSVAGRGIAEARDRPHAARAGRAREADQAHAGVAEVRCALDPLRGAVAAAAGRRQGCRPTTCSIRSTTIAWRRPSSARRELFFDSLVREDRSLLDLMTADYTFVNERVALHYGIPNITGSHFRKVTLPANRRGILGHGSILVLTSNSDRTSPVYRGKWVMEVLLGSPPPPPPPNVPELDEVKSTGGGRTLSVRERMEEHRKNPTCNSCHRVIDPLGPRARELRSDGRLAHQGQRGDGRPGRHALRRHED